MSERDRAGLLLPSGLRERVLQASHQARAAGTSLPEVADISPVEAFGRAADAFFGVLCVLDEQDWHRPVLRDLDVQGLVGHLIGVEDDVQRCLAGDPLVADDDHVRSTQAAALRQRGRAPRQTRADWRAASTRTLRLVEASEDIDVEVAVHGMELSIGTLLVVRAFELWTHENDIRTVAGLPPSVPDDSTLKLMTALATRALPHGASRIDWREPTVVHLVLTGAGGGTWDVAVGAASPDAVAVRIVADAVAFCRLAANRTSAADLDLHVEGDPQRIAAVLAAVAALALD
jgi:hypothetical protein